jgi:hypothetical protein
VRCAVHRATCSAWRCSGWGWKAQARMMLRWRRLTAFKLVDHAWCRALDENGELEDGTYIHVLGCPSEAPCS